MTTTVEYDTTYDLFPEATTNAVGETTRAVWDPICGTPTSTTDLNGLPTTFETDALCRPTETHLPDGGYQYTFYLNTGTPTNQYTLVQTPPSIPGDFDQWVVSYFDGLGRTYHTRTKGPQAIWTDTTYNARGGVATATEPYYQGDTPNITSYSYDGFDRLVTMTHPDDTTVTTSYGLLETTVTDERGKQRVARSDIFGRTIEEVRFLDGQPPLTTTTTYDLLGRRTELEDAIGTTWWWTYDSLGHTLDDIDPNTGTLTFEYDDAGRLFAQTDAKGQRIEFGYDAAGRFTTKTVIGSPDLNVAVTYGESRLGYFNAGAQTTVATPVSTLKLDYDEAGRTVRQTRTLDSIDYVIEHRYDSGGFLRGITYPDDDTFGTLSDPLRYDAAGRPIYVPGVVSDVQYDAVGRALQLSNANQTQTFWTYSPQRGFLTNILTQPPEQPFVQDLMYTYDASGIVDSVSSQVANEGWNYTYDDLDRLTVATNTFDPINLTQSYQYDDIDRMTYNSKVGVYTYPGVGSQHPHGPTNAGGVPLSYDANGNLESGQGRTLVWNAENRMSSATVGGTTVSFTDDGSGTRLKKTGGGVTSLYPFGDDYEITDGEVTKYLAVPGLGVVAKRVGYGPTAETFWLHSDRIGSIQAVTDLDGAEVYRRSYTPYGDTIAESTGHTESRGWIDQRLDDETGLTYLHARYYDSALGIFTSADPSGVAGGLNSYGYGRGNPISYTDRSGLEGSIPIYAYPAYPYYPNWYQWYYLNHPDDQGYPYWDQGGGDEQDVPPPFQCRMVAASPAYPALPPRSLSRVR